MAMVSQSNHTKQSFWLNFQPLGDTVPPSKGVRMSEVNRRYFEGLLEGKRMSLRGLAKLMGVSHSQLSLTFSGDRRLQLDEAAQLSTIFSVPLHKIVEAAGVTVHSMAAHRVSVVGFMNGDGTVTMYDDTVERTTAPEGVPMDGIAVQARTSGTALDWLDAAVMFCPKPNGIDPSITGRLALAKIKDGPTIVGGIRRGYRDNTYAVRGPYVDESVRLEWATPVLISRH